MVTVKISKLLAIGGVLFLVSCSTGKHGFNPLRKIPKEQLQQDYTVFRSILEEGHPSLYWYTSKDSLDQFFDQGYLKITDSMTEVQFRTLLSYTISKINCGHTTVRYSRRYYRYLDTVKLRQFPLSIKLWKDSAVIYANLHSTDTLLKRGTVIKSINDRDLSFYTDSLFQFIPMDGFGLIHKYQTLSNMGTFAGWYRNVFGLSDRFKIGYLTQSGEPKNIEIPVYDPLKDSAARWVSGPLKKRSRKARKQEALLNSRSMQFDTATSTAYLTLNNFLRGDGLSLFIRRTFKTLHRQKARNLVIDVRSNGGGNVGISNLLTKYIVNRRFKLADSLYAINRRSRFGRHIQHYFWNRLFMSVITKKRADKKYHFGYFERHYFKPKRKYHFDGDVYVVTGGNSFSATTLFADAIKGQKNVVLVGEETGGGAYGNTAWMIPDVTLPYSKVRFRLPKFRMVVNKDFVKDGRGVMPDITVAASVESIRKGIDPKMEKVKELISEKGKGMADRSLHLGWQPR